MNERTNINPLSTHQFPNISPLRLLLIPILILFHLNNQCTSPPSPCNSCTSVSDSPVNRSLAVAMSVSRPTVHPIASPPLTDRENLAPPRVRMKDIQGMPGTALSLILRLCQFAFAGISLCVMATTSDSPSVTAFCYLLSAVSLQSFWSLGLAVVDIYVLLVKRSLRNPRVIVLFTVGDGITSTLTFASACASAGITVLLSNGLGTCNINHCKRFMSATAMAFLSWFAVSPSFFLNFWSLAS